MARVREAQAALAAKFGPSLVWFASATWRSASGSLQCSRVLSPRRREQVIFRSSHFRRESLVLFPRARFPILMSCCAPMRSNVLMFLMAFRSPYRCHACTTGYKASPHYRRRVFTTASISPFLLFFRALAAPTPAPLPLPLPLPHSPLAPTLPPPPSQLISRASLLQGSLRTLA